MRIERSTRYLFHRRALQGGYDIFARIDRAHHRINQSLAQRRALAIAVMNNLSIACSSSSSSQPALRLSRRSHNTYARILT